MGGGLDVFYDGVFVQQGNRGTESYTQNTRFGRYFIPTEDLANKFRAGVCLSNEFIIGRLTAVLQWGVYVYDPIRNATHDPHPVYGDNRPMLYSYDIEKEAKGGIYTSYEEACKKASTKGREPRADSGQKPSRKYSYGISRNYILLDMAR